MHSTASISAQYPLNCVLRAAELAGRGAPSGFPNQHHIAILQDPKAVYEAVLRELPEANHAEFQKHLVQLLVIFSMGAHPPRSLSTPPGYALLNAMFSHQSDEGIASDSSTQTVAAFLATLTEARPIVTGSSIQRPGTDTYDRYCSPTMNRGFLRSSKEEFNQHFDLIVTLLAENVRKDEQHQYDLRSFIRSPSSTRNSRGGSDPTTPRPSSARSSSGGSDQTTPRP